MPRNDTPSQTGPSTTDWCKTGDGGSTIRDIAALSLRARLAIALRLFAWYCEQRGLQHPEVTAYLDYLWWFVGMDGSPETFGQWSESEPPLIEAGLGWEWPDGFPEDLAACGVAEREFRQVVCAATEVLYGSLYGAADALGSLRFVSKLAAVVAPPGVPFPNIAAFAGSRWADGSGWGLLVGSEQALAWRAAQDTEPNAAPDNGA